MMFEGDDCQALQTHLDNNTITTGASAPPFKPLSAIQMFIKDKEHLWHYCDEVLSELRQHQMKASHIKHHNNHTHQQL